MRLYEIEKGLEEFETRLADAEGELTPEMEKEWQKLIDCRADKWRSYIAIIRQLEMEEEGYRAEAERLMRSVKSRTNGVKWLKLQMLLSMQNAGIEEIKTDIGKLKIMLAPTQSVKLHVPSILLPADLQRVTIEANLQEIAKRLKAHDPETERLAWLEEKKPYVRIF